MKINYKSLCVLLAAGLAYDEVVAKLNRRRFNSMMDRLKSTEETCDRAVDVANYYAYKLNQAGVPADDFDKIVIDDLIR